MRKLVWIFGLFLLLTIPAAAQDFPKAEVFGGYSYFHANILGTGFNFHGGSGSIAFNLNHWLAIVGDVGGYHNGDFGISTNVITYLFGPKFSYRRAGRITPFAQALFGAAHENENFIGVTASDNAFAMALGGGLDARVTQHVGIRLIQAEYLLTKFPDGENDRQNNARISAGIVFRWGGGSSK